MDVAAVLDPPLKHINKQIKITYIRIYLGIERVLLGNMLYYHLRKLGKNQNFKDFLGAVLMDLSKVFDTLNQRLLTVNLIAHGFTEKSLI